MTSSARGRGRRRCGTLRPSWDLRLCSAYQKKLPEQLLRGYELALRPKRLLGRFRSPASEIDEMLVAIRDSLAKDSIRRSITGGPAAYLLQKFYRGLELPIFIESLNDQLSSALADHS